MNATAQMNFQVDKENKTINVERTFNAPLDLVWAAWTQADLLDRWWAPKPWRAETKAMTFTDGGRWHYAMVGPDGEKHWSLVDFESVTPTHRFTGWVAFSDEQGMVSPDQARSFWENTFMGESASTTVQITIRFNELADLEMMVQMGFQGGLTMGMNNLDELLQTL